MRVVLHPAADREFTEAARYYETQRPGLGADFILAVDEAVADLQAFPYRWRIIENGVRRGLLRRFPYASATASVTRSTGSVAMSSLQSRYDCATELPIKAQHVWSDPDAKK